MPIRILVVQYHNRPIARGGLCRLLEGQAQFELVGEVSGTEAALESVLNTAPNIVVFDALACDAEEIQLLSELAQLGDSYQILVLTSSPDPQAHHRAIAAGAMGLVQQNQSIEIFCRAIECVCAGEIWIERTMAASVLRDKMRSQGQKPDNTQLRIATLTEREREVVTLICLGLKNQIIAQQLFVSEATVRHRLTAIFEKLGLSDRLELVIFAFQHGLAELPR